jgi:hypothetical protein
MGGGAVVHAAARDLSDLALAEGKKLIDLEGYLTERFEDAGESGLRAIELAEEWTPRMREAAQMSLEEWSVAGVPPPAVHLRGARFLTLRHPRYPEIAPSGGLPTQYPAWLDLIEHADPKQFTLLCCAWLSAAGCTEIYVIDAAYDSGVDCFGVIRDGALRALCLLAQAKTSAGTIAVATLRGDYHHYVERFWDSTLAQRCLDAARLREIPYGLAATYVFLTSNDFGVNCAELAHRHRLLLRTRRQVAYTLACGFDFARLVELVATRTADVRRRLDFNWAPILEELRIGDVS